MPVRNKPVVLVVTAVVVVVVTVVVVVVDVVLELVPTDTPPSPQALSPNAMPRAKQQARAG
jgi:hypothetical protein